MLDSPRKTTRGQEGEADSGPISTLERGRSLPSLTQASGGRAPDRNRGPAPLSSGPIPGVRAPTVRRVLTYQKACPENRRPRRSELERIPALEEGDPYRDGDRDNREIRDLAESDVTHYGSFPYRIMRCKRRAHGGGPPNRASGWPNYEAPVCSTLSEVPVPDRRRILIA